MFFNALPGERNPRGILSFRPRSREIKLEWSRCLARICQVLQRSRLPRGSRRMKNLCLAPMSRPECKGAPMGGGEAAYVIAVAIFFLILLPVGLWLGARFSRRKQEKK